MLLNKYETRKKEAVKIQQELNNLYKIKYKIDPLPLEKPIFNGWKRNLVIRDEIKQRADYGKILQTYKLLGTHSVYSDRKDFIVNSKSNKRAPIELHAGIKTIRHPSYMFFYSDKKRQDCIDTIKSVEKYLTYHYQMYMCSCDTNKLDVDIIKHKVFVPHYSFRFPWMLEEVTKPHYLTHYTPIDADLESRITYLRNKVEKHPEYRTIVWGRDRSDGFYRKEWVESKADTHKLLFSIDDKITNQIYSELQNDV